MADPTDEPSIPGYDHHVAVVGGGPAGCSAGVFTARAGLGTVIFDRGRSSLRQCAYLENYLGFPGGIDVETLYDLMYDHAETAGCVVVENLIDSVERDDDGGFVLTPQESDPVTARRVIAATRYGGDYLRGLDDPMFETGEHDGEEYERFDRSYADTDGTTPVEGLYIASPSEADRQAITAAGRGARAGIALVADVRRTEGYPDPLADHYDWVRRSAERSDEWSDRDRWREWFDDRLPEDHGLDDERRVELRERAIDRRFGTYLSDGEIDRQTRRGHERLLASVDDDLILDAAAEIEARRGSADRG